MCYHSQEELDAALRREDAYARRQGIKPTVAAIIMKDPTTKEFKESYITDASNLQAISNTIRNLKAWHPEPKICNIEQINARRKELGLMRADFHGLPTPNGSVPPSEDHGPGDEEDEDEEDVAMVARAADSAQPVMA